MCSFHMLLLRFWCSLSQTKFLLTLESWLHRSLDCRSPPARGLQPPESQSILYGWAAPTPAPPDRKQRRMGKIQSIGKTWVTTVNYLLFCIILTNDRLHLSKNELTWEVSLNFRTLVPPRNCRMTGYIVKFIPSFSMELLSMEHRWVSTIEVQSVKCTLQFSQCVCTLK